MTRMLRHALLAAIVLAAPAAFAQATPEATIARFVEFANAGQLMTPEGQAIITGEVKAMATGGASTLPAPDRVLTVDADSAVARIVLQGEPGQEADFYFYLEKEAGAWRVSAFRQMTVTAMNVMLLREMKKQASLSPAEQDEKRNLELLLSSDRQLRTWFAANRMALDALAHDWLVQPAPRSLTRTDDPVFGARLKAIGVGAIEDLAGGARIVIGAMDGDTVGLLRAGPSGPPPASPSGFIWVEPLGDGWYLFRTT